MSIIRRFDPSEEIELKKEKSVGHCGLFTLDTIEYAYAVPRIILTSVNKLLLFAVYYSVNIPQKQ